MGFRAAYPIVSIFSALHIWLQKGMHATKDHYVPKIYDVRTIGLMILNSTDTVENIVHLRLQNVFPKIENSPKI